MENLVFVFIIAAIAFWLGRKTKDYPSTQPDPFNASAIRTHERLPEIPASRIPMNGQRAFALLFISGWLIAWSAGIFMAGVFFIATLGTNFVTIFLGGWLIAALAGWFYAASTIYKLVTGKPVDLRGGQFR